jgi:hypothetical protein
LGKGFGLGAFLRFAGFLWGGFFLHTPGI